LTLGLFIIHSHNPFSKFKQMKKLLLILTAALLASCTMPSGPSKPPATGRAGEMLIIMDKNKWDGPMGEIVRDVFAAPIPMMLQREPFFDLVHITPSGFVPLFETHRHILMVDINPGHERSRIEIQRHHWAYPQLVVRISAPDDSTFERVLQNNATTFIDYYLDMETLRLVEAYNRMPNHQARNAVRNKFGYNLAIPQGYFVAVEAEDFMWIRRTGTRDDLEMGILIAVLPYRDPAVDFNPANIRLRRDSLTRKHIPGQLSGSFMATYRELDHDYREIDFNGLFAVEARGLWRVEGDFMGGPFVNYTLVDEERNRLIILDGFVYAPKFDKRDYLRQVEAIIRSIKFNGENDQEQEQQPA
jgi:hypothetical protein